MALNRLAAAVLPCRRRLSVLHSVTAFPDLSASRKEIMTLLDSSIDYELSDSKILVLLGDRAGNFVYANPAFLEASGYSWDEIKGTLAVKMVHSDTPVQVM